LGCPGQGAWWWVGVFAGADLEAWFPQHATGQQPDHRLDVGEAGHHQRGHQPRGESVVDPGQAADDPGAVRHQHVGVLQEQQHQGGGRGADDQHHARDQAEVGGAEQDVDVLLDLERQVPGRVPGAGARARAGSAQRATR
jgi:hypothetical protein